MGGSRPGYRPRGTGLLHIPCFSWPDSTWQCISAPQEQQTASGSDIPELLFRATSSPFAVWSRMLLSLVADFCLRRWWRVVNINAVGETLLHTSDRPSERAMFLPAGPTPVRHMSPQHVPTMALCFLNGLSCWEFPYWIAALKHCFIASKGGGGITDGSA